jgi:hypothetical protein
MVELLLKYSKVDVPFELAKVVIEADYGGDRGLNQARDIFTAFGYNARDANKYTYKAADCVYPQSSYLMVNITDESA